MFSSIGIRSRTTEFSGAQLFVDPVPVEGDSAVDAVDVRETAAVAETDVPDEDMLLPALIGQRTPRVSLAERQVCFNKKSIE